MSRSLNFVNSHNSYHSHLDTINSHSEVENEASILEESSLSEVSLNSLIESTSASPINIYTSISKEFKPIVSKSKIKKNLLFSNVFNSKIFTTYYSQLQKFANKQLSKGFLEELKQMSLKEKGFYQEARSLIELIQSELPDQAHAKREIHEKMIHHLRSLIKQKKAMQKSPLGVEISDFVDSICYWMYTQPDLLNPVKVFFKKTMGLSYSNPTKLNPSSVLKQFNQFMEDSGKLKKFSSLTKTFTDTHLFGSLPFKLYKIGSTQVIYMSRITIDSDHGKTIKISEEFKNYLLTLKKEGKTHLYINLMKRLDSDKDKGKATNGMLSKVIEALEKDPDFQDVFMVASLDKNSHFYKQKDEFEKKYGKGNNAELFKNDFMDQLFQPNKKSFFKWPQRLDLTQWRETAKDILQSVHKTYFKDKVSLSTKERKIFIEIVYSKIIKSLHEQLKPDMSNITCKHSKDRAPGMYGLVYLLEKFESKKNLTQTDMEDLLAMVLAPAILSHNTGISEKRLKNFLETFKHMIKHYSA